MVRRARPPVGAGAPAAGDAQPLLAWGNCELRRFAGRLYLLPTVYLTASFPLAVWKPDTLPGGVDPKTCSGMIGAEECMIMSGYRRVKWKTTVESFSASTDSRNSTVC